MLVNWIESVDLASLETINIKYVYEINKLINKELEQTQYKKNMRVSINYSFRNRIINSIKWIRICCSIYVVMPSFCSLALYCKINASHKGMINPMDDFE